MKNILILAILTIFISCTKESDIIQVNETVKTQAEYRANPDLSPEHTTGSTSYLPRATKEVVIRIRNFGSAPTSAPVVFYVTKMDPVFTVTFDSTATAYTPAFTTFTLNNGDWTVVEQATRWKFTSKPGIVINSASTSYVGIKLTAGSNGNATLNTTIVSGTGGGETPTSNNLKITNLSISN